MQAVCPEAAPYVPGAQAVHAPRPLAEAYVPALHAVHLVAVAWETVPAPHVRHAVAPVVEVYFPAGHGPQSEGDNPAYPAMQLALQSKSVKIVYGY